MNIFCKIDDDSIITGIWQSDIYPVISEDLIIVNNVDGIMLMRKLINNNGVYSTEGPPYCPTVILSKPTILPDGQDTCTVSIEFPWDYPEQVNVEIDGEVLTFPGDKVVEFYLTSDTPGRITIRVENETTYLEVL